MVDSHATEKYVRGAPHLRHVSLRRAWACIIQDACEIAASKGGPPKVLDLGAGDGSATRFLLEAGAHVTAVDKSRERLDSLSRRCQAHSIKLRTWCGEAERILDEEQDTYDIVVAISFLHHVPEYVSLVEKAIGAIRPCGQFLSFQDPLRYDSVGVPTLVFSRLGYFAWRVFQGDYVGSLRRWARRRIHHHNLSCAGDEDYHVLRNGVDQDALLTLLRKHGFTCRILRYFSSQGVLFQGVGAWLRLENTFAIIAERRVPTE